MNQTIRDCMERKGGVCLLRGESSERQRCHTKTIKITGIQNSRRGGNTKRKGPIIPKKSPGNGHHSEAGGSPSDLEKKKIRKWKEPRKKDRFKSKGRFVREY